MPRRNTIGLLCAAAALMLLGGPRSARAEDYPSRPIHLIVTSPAGSLVDVLGRLYAGEMSARLGQPIVVDNRSGAMTQVGTEVLTHADPDGYTLMIGPNELTMLPFLKKDYRYDPTRDITPVALITRSWTVFAIYPGLPQQTLPEFIAYAKANPGKLHYGSGGVGGALHIAVEMLRLKTGIDLIHVPYRGGEQAATDAMAGADRDGVVGAGERPNSRRRQAAHPGADRAEPVSAVSRGADHGRIRAARSSHGHLVWSGRAAQHTRGHRGAA